jgi:integrase
VTPAVAVAPPAAQRAGLRRIRFHDLRASFVSMCAGAGVPLAKVGDWVGHADTRMTEVYRRASRDAEEFALAQLDEYERQARARVAPALHYDPPRAELTLVGAT